MTMPIKEGTIITAPEPQIPADLKIVFAVRHGDYDKQTGDLIGEGVRQAQALGKKIKQMIPGDARVAIFSSPTLRTRQTAKIIAEPFRTDFREADQLEGDRYKDGGYIVDQILPLSDGVDALILVTHSNAPSGIMNVLSQRAFNQPVKEFLTFKGNGCVIDLTTKSVLEALLL